ncbi:scavenger receptor cysteine-rich domain-containing group B protein-like isoform X2 [Amphiura filiformis]|uniref:scavenger receptor cysteine-rich domain-containing group B protein-like isoform X2 n=1 Tax=Amphiura filiformis TaxID=82378 RepID=UPI003B20FA0C
MHECGIMDLTLVSLCWAVLSFCLTTVDNVVAQEEFTVGLIWDTVPYAGYLKIFHNGKWGGVCPLSANWGWTHQDVVCRELGYPKANRRGGTIRPGHKDIPWVLDSVIMCNGTESKLRDCQHGPLGDYECPYRYHRSDSVYVTCSPLQPDQDLPVRLASGPNETKAAWKYFGIIPGGTSTPLSGLMNMQKSSVNSWAISTHWLPYKRATTEAPKYRDTRRMSTASEMRPNLPSVRLRFGRVTAIVEIVHVV